MIVSLLNILICNRRKVWALTLKDPGFLVFQIPGGGVESIHFEKRSLTTPHFHSRPANSISYESWHILLKFDTLLRLLRLKLRPREAAEVAKVQAKKNSIKNSEIGNFWATKTLYRGSPPYAFFGTWKKPCYMKLVLVGLYCGPLLTLIPPLTRT